MPIFGLEVRDFRRENYGKTPSKYGRHGEFPLVTSACLAPLATRKTIDILPCFIVVFAIKWQV